MRTLSTSRSCCRVPNGKRCSTNGHFPECHEDADGSDYRTAIPATVLANGVEHRSDDGDESDDLWDDVPNSR